MVKSTDNKLNVIKEKISNMDVKLSNVETKLSRLEDRVDDLSKNVHNLSQEVATKHNEQMNKLDSIAKMLETDEEERIIAGGQIDKLHEEIEKLQKIHPNYAHCPVVV